MTPISQLAIPGRDPRAVRRQTGRRLPAFAASLLLAVLAGCAAGPRPVAPPPPVAAEVVPVAVPVVDEDAAAVVEAPTLRQIEPGTGVFINRDAARQPRPDPGAAGEVTFNFEGESLHAVVKAILGDFLQENYVVAPGVQGTVTFSTAKPLRGEQALSILEMLLRWNNATLVWEDGRYTVLPVAQAIPGNLTPRLGGVEDTRGFEVRAVPLEYISATEMEKLLKPYARPDAVVSVDNARNLIVLAGTGSELANYLQTVEIFDVDWLAGMSVGVFPMMQTEATTIVTELETVFGAGADTPLAGMFRFLPLEGINAVLVITPQPQYLQKAEEWLQRLDQGAGGAGQRLYVYDVKNIKAQDLADTLGQVFGTGSVSAPARDPGDFVAPGLEPVEIRTVGRDGRTDPNLPRENRPVRDAAAKSAAGGANAVASGPLVDAAGGIALAATEEVRISAVEESNALLVLATSSQWESIRHVIERLDQIPLQVQIEAQIIQVTLNDELSYGVKWYFENAITTDVVDAASINRRGQNWISDVAGSITNGVNWTFIGKNMAAIVSAIDSVSDLRVLSAPSLVVLNNKSASINVGVQIPVESVVINNPIGQNPGIGGSSYTQFRDTGITLDVTPRVNPGGLVFMEISQNDSEALPASGTSNNLSVSQRTITTEVAVQSGETVMLGGLIKQTDSDNRDGVPFLSRIPILGALFGGHSKTSERAELLVLIKPTVIRNAAEARRITDEYRARFRGIEPLRVQLD